MRDQSDSLYEQTIPFNRPCVGEREKAAVLEALNNDILHGAGPVSDRVERRLENLLGAEHVFLTTSCTHALEMATLALDVRPGDEVIMPSFNFVSAGNSVVLRGGRPVFADIREDTLNLDPDDVARKISDRTVGVMPVHYAGVACDMEGLHALTEEHELWIIEDAAQAVDAYFKDQHLGTLGDVGCLSFHDTKNLTSGEGGAFVTNDAGLAKKAEIIREKGTNRSAFYRGEVDKYTWVARGSSYIPSDLLAALLEGQLERRREIKSKRERVWSAYYEEFREWEERGTVSLPVVPGPATPNYHIFFLLAGSPEEQDALLDAFRSEGLQATFHYVPLHRSPVGKEFWDEHIDLPVTDSVADRLIRLPLYPSLVEHIPGITGAVRRAMKSVYLS